MARGLDYSGIKQMELGHLVDFCIEWNKVNNPDENAKDTKPKKTKRKANQADWDAFLG